MEDEERRKAFITARIQLRQILNSLNRIDNEITSLKNTASETVLIDNNIVGSDQYQNGKNELSNAKNSVLNAIYTANNNI